MKALHLHDWQVTPARAVIIQRELAGRISTEDEALDVKLIAGVDISVSRMGGVGRGAVVEGWRPGLKRRPLAWM